MGADSALSGKSSPPAWPPDAGSYYRPTLFAAVAAGAGIAAGSLGTWANVLWFAVGGLDFGNWGTATLVLSVVSVLASLTVMFWSRTPFNPRWAVPVAWGIAVVGVACSTDAVINIVRLMTVPKGNIFNVPIGVSAGWGLWLVTFSSAIMAVAGTIIATQVAGSDDLHQHLAESAGSWTNRWRWAAVVASAIIVLAGIIYAVTNPWKGDADSSTSLRTELPSFPSFPSSPVSATTPSVTTSAQATLPPVVQAPPLDGTYREDIDEANVTKNGKVDPGTDTDPTWFAFRSACTAAGCVASGSFLDRHKLGLPLQSSAKGFELYWINDHWQYSHTEKTDCSGPDGNAKEERSYVWTFVPQPDGFFRGTTTNTTLTDECSNEGEERVEPFTLTRSGPPPPGAIDPPIALAGQPPAPPPQPQRQPPDHAGATVVFGGQQLTTSTKPPHCYWKDGKADIYVDAPNTKTLVSLSGLTKTEVESLDISTGEDTSYRFEERSNATSTPGATASVIYTGRKSYTIAGMVSGFDIQSASYFVEPYKVEITCP
ncbi:lipoprotein LpqH [Mycobacterium colombiense]